MKITFATLILSFLCIVLYAQQPSGIVVTVLGKQQASMSLDQIKQLPGHTVDSLRIYNHTGAYRSTLKNIQGGLLKDLLKDIPFGAELPKVLSEYYLVCEATDGYKVVFSWNELFNTAIGNQALLVTNIEQASNGKEKDPFALLSTADLATGRRYVKGLCNIHIRRIGQ
ncbi:molybdopterin-binding protein [Sphingobacterium sp. ML3W]|uniref:molybdopterin-binding protein n=1 Tax=Sphingobacterium sp. ML3W TaxID=1538644 RepID=UPI00249BE1A7|nr:molybdopterin-binding protein [Sphingobacterium sp. ML3W]WFA80737.1 molybdopterin-binding protein [Sphingobacterium sp. ML3W]